MRSQFHRLILISALALSFILIAPLRASPDDEIMLVVSADGARNVQQAEPRVYLNVFSSVLARKKERDVPAYVSAAVKLRRDLADKIVAAALKSRQLEYRSSHDLPCRIVKAAVAAAPDAKRAIVHAALKSCPWAHKCILTAAEIDENKTPFLRLAGLKGGNINSTMPDTINPGNISDGSGGNTQSPEQPPTP